MLQMSGYLSDRLCLCSGSHHRKQELVKELQRNGVNFDVRKLNVGDFLWVAREKVSPVPGNTVIFMVSTLNHENYNVILLFVPSSGQLRAPAGRELVLDYIIERKRMDDLCGSIIDGRFREQKVGISFIFSIVDVSSKPLVSEPEVNGRILLGFSLHLCQFRLKRCGLRKPIYLVEEHGKSASHLSLPEATLLQAIVNTQVCLCTHFSSDTIEQDCFI